MTGQNGSGSFLEGISSTFGFVDDDACQSVKQVQNGEVPAKFWGCTGENTSTTDWF